MSRMGNNSLLASRMGVNGSEAIRMEQDKQVE